MPRVAGRAGHADDFKSACAGSGETDRQPVVVWRNSQIAVAGKIVDEKRLAVGCFKVRSQASGIIREP